MTLDTIYCISDNIVSREIDGEIVIVPIAAGIGDADDEIFTLNETGRVVWQKLDGRRTLRDVVALLESEYGSTSGQLEKDVLGFANELVRRGMLSVKN